MWDQVLGKALDVFSPPEACRAPSGTIASSLLVSFDNYLYSSLALLLSTSFEGLGTYFCSCLYILDINVWCIVGSDL